MNDRLPISLVVITCDEERNLARCLRAGDFCSDLVVVDSGSTDRTLEIAAEFGARVFHRNWTGYRDQKNFGTQQARNDWVLCIDADEEVSPELRAEMIRHFQTDPAYDGFEMNRHSLYAGRFVNHSGWYPQWRLFLYRRTAAEWSGDEPHTVVRFTGERKMRLRGDLYHHTYSSIRQHVIKNVNAACDAAQAMHRRGRRATVFDFIIRSPWAVFRSYVIQRGFLDSFYGFVIAMMAGLYTFLKYAQLHELNRQAKKASRSHAAERES